MNRSFLQSSFLINEVVTFSHTECLCVHGTCNAGPRGDGSCQCYPGYQGVYCDQGMPSNICVQIYQQ